MLIKNKDIHRIYLDASVLISFLEGESDTISELLTLCKKEEIPINVSPFTIMESLDIKQEHGFFTKEVAKGVPFKRIISRRRERNLTKEQLTEIYHVLRNKLKPHNMEDFWAPDSTDWWAFALDIVRDSNITASDSIHIAQAIFLECDLLATTDNFLIEEGNKYLKEIKRDVSLKICLPEKIIKILSE